MSKTVAAGVGVWLALTLALLPVEARPQAPEPCGVAKNGTDVDVLMTRFHAGADEYDKTFQNLVAEETKVIEVFRASGEVEKRREIVSDLLVYRTSREGKEATTEYRDVRSVDGKPVAGRGERVLKLLANASKTDSLEKELEAINRETERYEFRRNLRNFTIQQGGVTKGRRQAFHVELAGREQIAGHDVVVLAYRQTAPIPGFVSSIALPKEFGQPLQISRGRLWLDAETCQLWRDEWELVVAHPATPDPLAIVRRESAYEPSRFGILVPQRIVFNWLQRFSHPKNGPPSFTLSERATFTYGAFKRFEVGTGEVVKTLKAPDR